MSRIIVGILAHVDAGKTTLSEALLYQTGSIRKIGRVDKKDTFLDTDVQERARGITIFSKQAELAFQDLEITLLDTPGHVDFSAEMERTLQVLDYAILVISGSDGVQGHTNTLWKLLEKYRIPVFLFINKMDQPGTDKETILAQLKERLSDGCIDFEAEDTEKFYEDLAVTEETMLESFLEEGKIAGRDIQKAIKRRKVFPCYFGSALKLDGVEAFLQGIYQYTEEKEYPDSFGARIYKISRDDQGNRLTHMKITGGSLKVKDLLKGRDWEEKVNQIRIYSGEKYKTSPVVKAGEVCAVCGLTMTKAGEGLGIEEKKNTPLLEPVFTYCILLPEGCDASQMLPKIRQLEEEDPQLHIHWNEDLGEIQAQMMGEVQIEILQNLIEERFGVKVAFDEGNIVYKETISDRVEGVGHYEPLRHYAEVHLILEPLEEGSGLVFETTCSEDKLNRNWQRLILTHLMEKEHRGVLMGAPITDMKITLASGRAHQKHTEGGDFRQATYRAVRQGLRKAQSVLLEPWYDFRIELPKSCVGRAMSDVEKMKGTFALEYEEDQSQEGEEYSIITGSAPVYEMRGYAGEIRAYTKGLGRFFCTLSGYRPCHNEEEILSVHVYDPEADLDNPTSSVFCAHGAGFVVNWDQVEDYMHLESVLKAEKKTEENKIVVSRDKTEERWIGEDEVEAIIQQTFYANQQKGEKKRQYKKSRSREYEFSGTTYYSSTQAGAYREKSKEKKEEYLLVDGYNIIFAWEELSKLAQENIDSARDKLMDLLCNYQGIRRCNLIVVFDAYRVKGHDTETLNYHNIHVVYTKEAETADAYIEKFAHENGKKYQITVATSDRLEQMIITGAGCQLLSAREFKEEVEKEEQKLREEILEQQKSRRKDGQTIEDAVTSEKIHEFYQQVNQEET
ncbi:MAG: TetM/TetW/TetO/TetS family tetracycline resistance ribosomal protection protein [Lachnospiraceae bacterium]|nr:TetM/TetW/TetO/TetS family tetracycline resistance ribosomal protection protein [Lachnospiraceae bacterium]